MITTAGNAEDFVDEALQLDHHIFQPHRRQGWARRGFGKEIPRNITSLRAVMKEIQATVNR